MKDLSEGDISVAWKDNFHVGQKGYLKVIHHYGLKVLLKGLKQGLKDAPLEW